MGVVSVVKFGPAPARCPDEEIARLIARADPDGPRPLSSSARVLTPSAAIAVTGGPFAGLNGVCAGVKPSARGTPRSPQQTAIKRPLTAFRRSRVPAAKSNADLVWRARQIAGKAAIV